MNRLGLGISHDEIERIIMGLTKKTIKEGGFHRTLILYIIKDSVIIQRARDNFDHEETTPSRIGVRRDTILIL